MRNLLLAALAVVICAGTARAALFSHFVVFGDSLSDNGNAYSVRPARFPLRPLYTVGRFTTERTPIPPVLAGGIWHEVLSGLLGEPVATPFLAGGTNYAVGGAKVLPGDPVIPSLEQQVGSRWRPRAGMRIQMPCTCFGEARTIYTGPWRRPAPRLPRSQPRKPR